LIQKATKKEEAQLLHGIYFACNQTVGITVPFRSWEILWALHAGIPETARWRLPNGGFKSFESKKDSDGDCLQDLTKLRSRVLPSLTYLREAGYVSYESTSAQDMFNIAVTFKGAELARALNTKIGRLNIWCRKNKDGLLGVLITILVSIITAMLTA